MGASQWLMPAVMLSPLLILAGMPLVESPDTSTDMVDGMLDAQSDERPWAVSREPPDVARTGCGAGPSLHKAPHCAHIEIWETSVEAGGFLFVQYRIDAPSEGGVAYAYGPADVALDRPSASGGGVFDIGTRNLLMVLFEPQGAALGAAFGANEPIETMLFQTGETARVGLEERDVAPMTRGGDADWERVTLRGEAAFDEPFYAVLRVQGGGIGERFTATSAAGEEHTFSPGKNAGYWYDAAGVSGRMIAFAGGLGEWDFEMSVARPHGASVSASLGLVLSPLFLTHAVEAPHFEPWSLVGGEVYGPGHGFQERPPYRPADEIVIVPPPG